MVTTVADRAVLDTNVLLAATDHGRAEHVRALSALNDWPAAGSVLYTSGQILREYVAVVTRPLDQNGLGMAQSDAVTNARTLHARLSLVDENEKVSKRLMTLLDDVACSGNQVHDANVVATMLVHGIDTLVTSNVDHFARFEDHITVPRFRPERKTIT